MNTEPKWFRILRYWIDKKDGHGLSFSFLIGATRIPVGQPFDSESDAIELSRSLYEEIISAPVHNFAAHLHDCDKVDGCVVTLEFGMKPTDYPMPSFEELWDFYGQAVAAGNYSLTNGRFHPMTGAEKAWVTKALE